MRIITFHFIILCLLPIVALAQTKPFLQDIYHYIENPQMIELNQTMGHVPFLPYASAEKAIQRLPEESSGFLSLNGKWKFSYAVNPEGIQKDFYMDNFNEKSMNEIVVPGNWQMQGYGEKIFRNIAQPFKVNPPFIPRDYNPVGSYKKHFVLPKEWKGKQILLHFEAVSSAFFLWINGQEVGYNQGAYEPSEFDITKFMKEGENSISLMVFMFSDGTYLEDQDTWRLSGIHRSVYITAVPKVHIRDYYVTTDLDEKYENAILKLQADIQDYDKKKPQGFKLKFSLLNSFNKPIIKDYQSDAIIFNENSSQIKFSIPVSSPEKWSAEKPNLYKIVLELVDSNGKTLEAISDRIGFKETEIRKQVFYLNGVPVKLNGVNSHMQHPDLGHAMDLETIRKDLYLMKQFNINCVRTSHYPPLKEYLELADSIGMYIVDETGDESHACEYISNDPQWTKSYVERVEKMVLRDRNHPCILFWSAGNESGSGQNICEVINAGKKLDPSRPGWMYGGNDIDKPGFNNPVKCEEIIGPRYGTPYELKVYFGQSPEEVDPRPSFMDEYLAATGNSLGGLDEYWDVIYNYPRCMGGAIWDWVSPGLREKYISTPDNSGHNNTGALMGLANLVPGKFGQAVQLSGTDSWIELYRDPSLDITGKELTISFWVKPAKWNGNGTFISKGGFQYGIEQINENELEFYIGNKEKFGVKSSIPQNWVDNWHHVVGIYNGNKLQLIVDEISVAEKECNINIENKPYQVNIGRNPEIEGQEWSSHLSNATFDEFAIFNKVVESKELINANESIKKSARVWLSFDEKKENGTYFSMGIGGRTYGVIWPNRVPQPELWQVKKSAQPISVKLIDEAKGEIEIWNHFSFTNTRELQAIWKIQCEGKIIKEGEFETNVPTLEKSTYSIPFQPLQKEEGKEYFLFVGFNQKDTKPWAGKGFEIAWEQIPLKIDPVCKKEEVKEMPAFVGNDSILQVSGKDFSYTFQKKSGKISSIKYKNLEIIKDGLDVNLWRAPLANDLDNWTIWNSELSERAPGMGSGPVNSWYTLGLDKITTVTDNVSWTKAENKITILVKSHSFASDVNVSFDNIFVYTIDGNGKMDLEYTITPTGKVPEWLPRVGLKMVLDKTLQQASWYGRGPFETYPDRKTGAKLGVYEDRIENMYTPYLIPQENGNRTDVRWLTLMKENLGIKISSDQKFNFSALAIDPDNLSRALYPFQIKPFDGINLNLDYAISGVGCTAICTLDKYKVRPTEFVFKLEFEPVFK